MHAVDTHALVHLVVVLVGVSVVKRRAGGCSSREAPVILELHGKLSLAVADVVLVEIVVEVVA